MQPVRALPFVLVCLSLVGCASSQPTGSPTTTVTVTETEAITETVTIAEEPAPEPVDSTLLEGRYFSLSYPSDWDVETVDEPKGGYLDTTIRSSDDADVMVRVDVTPGSGAAPAQVAREVEAYLVRQSGYRQIGFETTTLNGYEAFNWEFVVRQDGVLLRKADVFFTTAEGDSYAVLVQAPAAGYSGWLPLLEEIRDSLTLPENAAAVGSDSYDSGEVESDAEFCATHDCIDNFEEGRGSRTMCSDGTWSQSGGIQGACSHHGGVAGGSSDYGYGSDSDPNDDGSTYNWCGASRDGDGDGLWCEGR